MSEWMTETNNHPHGILFYIGWTVVSSAIFSEKVMVALFLIVPGLSTAPSFPIVPGSTQPTGRDDK